MSQSPPNPAPKAVYVKSYGCQMNVYDSQRMADVMGAEGYREVATRRRPTSSSSTPAISASGPPRRSIPSSAACGS